MNVVIIGGSGLIGTKLAARLREAGHAVTAASPSSGVNSVTGEGLAQALSGAQVVVDVSNSPSFADDAVMQFFQASTRRLLAAEAAAGVRHHVALSVVGLERLPDSGYFRAKLAQESLIEAGTQPYTLVRATQFLEFLGAIAQAGSEGPVVRLSGAQIQPIAADDVAQALADVATGAPLNGRLEIGGPETYRIDALIRRVLQARGDARTVVTDDAASYFGARLSPTALIAGPQARLGRTTLDAWLAAQRTV